MTLEQRARILATATARGDLTDAFIAAETPACIAPAHIEQQRDWSTRAFGPGDRAAGIVAHARKELDEIAAEPGDLTEWIDLMILAIDGAWRAGHEPAAIIAAYHAKCAANRARRWPDWRDSDASQPIEHIRDEATS